jgi:predicted acetyltransferase
VKLQLVWPTTNYLQSYIAALEQGWSANTMAGPEFAKKELDQINENADAFLASLVDREAKGAPIPQPDGSLGKRMPGYRRWLWDGEFCGSISLRWQPGASDLPPHVPGHIGYSVVPWKQGRGYAKEALRLLPPEAKAEGLKYVEIPTDLDNLPSQKVILANGGVLMKQFKKPEALGGKEVLLYRIDL